jgi:hypothetical protein
MYLGCLAWPHEALGPTLERRQGLSLRLMIETLYKKQVNGLEQFSTRRKLQSSRARTQAIPRAQRSIKNADRDLCLFITEAVCES